MEGTRPCPYCGEQIRVEAIRCRYCRSRLTAFDPESWHRDHPERRLAGVTTAVAHGLGISVGAVRAAFVLLTFFHFLGPSLYGTLWLLIPFRSGEDSLLARGLAALREIVEHLRRMVERPRSGNGHGQPPGPIARTVPEGPHA